MHTVKYEKGRKKNLLTTRALYCLLHSIGGKGMEVDVPLVYADYYFWEALLKKEIWLGNI